MKDSVPLATARFEPAYQAGPPWEIRQPQPVVVELANDGHIRSPVLDVGCGSGENAFELSRRGYDVVGIDSSPIAISRARAKARQRGSTASFFVWDALRLAELGLDFTTVIDSALFHIIPDRRRYAAKLAHVLRPGGRLYLLEISEYVSGQYPRVTRDDIRAAFAPPLWRIDEISADRYRVAGGHFPPGWLLLLALT